MRRLVSALAVSAGVALVSGGAGAQDDEELPDLEFLEYLGSWEEDDEEWFVDAEIEKEETAEGDAGQSVPGESVAGEIIDDPGDRDPKRMRRDDEDE